MAAGANLFKRAGGGGFLNGVTGTITGIKFESKAWNEGKDNEYSTLTAQVDVQPDGADESVPQFLRAGFFYPENQSISKDGHTLESDRDGAIIADDSDFARLVLSAIEAGFPEANLEPGAGRNFEPMVGGRYTFKREVDVEGTKKFGKRKSKDGQKEYNRDWLLVAEVLALPEAKKGAKKAAAPKVNGKPANGKAPVADDNSDLDAAMTEILGASKTGSVLYSGLNSAVVKLGMTRKLTNEDREALRVRLIDPVYLADAVERGVIAYDASAKKAEISLP